MDSLGHEVDVVGSIGPLSVYFSELSGRGRPRRSRWMWNEEMAGAQRKYPGRFWGTAAVPLVDTRTAIEVLDHAVNELGLIGANLPGSVGTDPRIDAERLEPFYDRVEELGIPLFLHPTDAIFADILDGYNEALHLSLGRVVEVSVGGHAAGALRHHGAPSRSQARDVAHRRRAALSGRPHGQELQEGRAAAACPAST